MRRFRLRMLRRVCRESRGASGIEFAIIAPVFFMFIFAIFETGLVFFAQQTLSHAVNVTSRQIRTGQAHSAQLTQSQFRDLVCAQVGYILSCDADKLYIDVQSYPNFAGLSHTPPLDGDGKVDGVNTNRFNIGESGNISGGSSIVLVRAFYIWPLFTPVISYFYANMTGNNRMVSATVAFKNEPF